MGFAGKSSCHPTTSHTPQINATVHCVLIHPDAVTQECSTRKRAGGINGNYTNSFFIFPEELYQFVNECALTSTRWAGNSNADRIQ